MPENGNPDLIEAERLLDQARQRLQEAAKTVSHSELWNAFEQAGHAWLKVQRVIGESNG